MSAIAGERRITGGRALAEMIGAHGPGPMFGMGGFQLLPYYEAMRQLGLRHNLINDERSGAFAADAQARVTGRPGVCDATLGPGATNLATALAESLNAGVPVIAIAGDAHRAHAGKHMTQEARQAEILRPVVKDVLRVEYGERIPELVRRAYGVATSGRPGPVLLLMPEDVSHAEFDYPDDAFWIDPAATQIPARRARPAGDDVGRAAAALSVACRPLILAGGGVHLSGAWSELTTLAERARIPVAHTLSGKGAIACRHPLSVGLFGRYSRIANDLIESADCLLVVGCKLGEIATKRYALPGSGAVLAHLDIEPDEIGHWARADVGLWGDAAVGLADLCEAVESGEHDPKRDAYLAEVEARRRQWVRSTQELRTSAVRPIGMTRLIDELNSAMPDDGVLVADGGFASHWCGLLYDTAHAGRGFVSDRGFASIGYGLPGALGIKAARPETTVVAMTGDGGMNMTLGELETARRVGADVVLIVINNAASGYVKALQHAVYGPGAYQSSDLAELNYARLAEEFGCRGLRIEDPAQLASSLETALHSDGRPTVVDVVVTRDPGAMLPSVDSRVLTVVPGDRPA